MKRRFGLVFAWVGIVCLLLTLGLQVDVNHPPAAWDRSVGPWRESLFTSCRTLLATSLEFFRSRASPLESLALHCALIAMDVGPPWSAKRGPPGAYGGPWVSCKAAGQVGTFEQWQEHVSTTNPARQRVKPQTWVLQQPLTSDLCCAQAGFPSLPI